MPTPCAPPQAGMYGGRRAGGPDATDGGEPAPIICQAEGGWAEGS